MDFDELESGDLFHSVAAIYDNANIKIAFIIFVTYIILNTDIFAERALTKFKSNAYDAVNDKITSSGICIAAMIMSMTYLIIDLLVSGNVI